VVRYWDFPHINYRIYLGVIIVLRTILCPVWSFLLYRYSSVCTSEKYYLYGIVYDQITQHKIPRVYKHLTHLLITLQLHIDVGIIIIFTKLQIKKYHTTRYVTIFRFSGDLIFIYNLLIFMIINNSNNNYYL